MRIDIKGTNLKIKEKKTQKLSIQTEKFQQNPRWEHNNFPYARGLQTILL